MKRTAWIPIVATLVMCHAALAQDMRWSELANAPFPGGYPTEAARKELLDEFYFQRAVQVYLGALPAVNMLAIRDGSEAKWGSGYNILPVWKERMDARAIIPTPNGDVVYAQSYLDLKKDGPLVVVAPPGLIGMFTDFWQRALTDVGVGGPDKGQGGLYLLLPPDYDGPVPGGYHTFRSPTYNVFLFWRALLTKGSNGPETAQAVKTIEATLVYPLRAGTPSEWKKMKFPDASGVAVNMMYPRDATFYDMLARFIDYEPSASADPYLRGMMASIGIVKGQPFKPDAHLRAILDKAARVAPKMAEAVNLSDGAIPQRNYYGGNVKRQWQNGYAGADDKFFSNSYFNVDVQSTFFLLAYSSAPYMNVNVPGVGARYPTTFRDADGNYLVGDQTYRLHLPANVPAALFWSLTLYSPVDGTMVNNGQPFPSINSIGNVARNEDGSYDLYFGPRLPDGAPESNWIRTNPGQGYAASLRLYGALMPFYDQTWIPDDVVKLK
ncbi:hypothetical protein B0G81_3315 [Paraburkholderia sp. BL6665CI2N2]|uniref:DUF1254 domain-containing protein n=1 Tax=Paraburkholderia sp. BL6665CI2N2 TaxID=1938806 RepID=UPI001066D86B|nr:DUF1254 domain-containing protein [Paraburkholderia sp. BL6665CI2N2]TDY22992.1 hypothetical protein B0G81_3315 [Paraburkholderia sp. BL6665CI2N2]